jgi:alanine racemase
VTFPLATIEAAALRNNLAVVRRLAPHSRVVAAVKANAYGHGLVLVARALADADAFGVARIEEAIALREAGIGHPVVLLEGVFSPDQLRAAAVHDFEIVVHCFEQLEMLEAHLSASRYTVWLKVDTGMNRLGFDAAQFAAAHERLRRCPAVGKLRLMSHLAAAEESGGEVARRQLALFQSLAGLLGLERSVANSAGLIAWPEARTDWVRPGLMLYGLSPFPDRDAASLGLLPAMTVTTRLIAIRNVPAGACVGYNGIWRAARDSRVAIAAIGYGDGYPRSMRNGGPVLVNGREAAVVGRVSMDMTAIDVTDRADVHVGDEVTLWGRGLPAERVAAHADSIAYELVCRVSERVAREWKL